LIKIRCFKCIFSRIIFNFIHWTVIAFPEHLKQVAYNL
jgi:hypothetical protein